MFNNYFVTDKLFKTNGRVCFLGKNWSPKTIIESIDLSLSLSLRLEHGNMGCCTKMGDMNNVDNNQAIMVGSLMEKLFGCTMKSKLSA
mgnify:CR=1 FL=1